MFFFRYLDICSSFTIGLRKALNPPENCSMYSVRSFSQINVKIGSVPHGCTLWSATRVCRQASSRCRSIVFTVRSNRSHYHSKQTFLTSSRRLVWRLILTKHAFVGGHLQDVKANRGADIGSDHVLVVATVSLKLRKAKRGEERQQRFDMAKLTNSNTEKDFKLELKNRFHVLQEEQEMNIDSFNQVLTETSKSLLGYTKNGNNNG